MQVKTFVAHSTAEVSSEISLAFNDSFRPNLAIVFCSINFEFSEVVSIFNELKIDLVGASTAGEIVEDTLYDGVITGLLIELNKNAYGIFTEEYEGPNPFSACFRLGEAIRQRFDNPSVIVLSGGVTIDAEQIVYGLKGGIKREIPIYGGLAADDLQLKATYSFSNNGVMSSGAVVLAFDSEKVELKGLATSGWEGVGMENTITHAEGNVVYTINGEPAVNAFIKYFGYFNNDSKGIEVSEISAQYPMQIMREDGSVILRAPLMSVESNGSLVLAGGVRNGEKFRFSIAPGFEVIDQTIEEFVDWKQGVQESPDALVLFSCKGRHAALGPLVEDEIKGIHDFWKKPMIGFFTYGEIGHLKSGVCEFHNETCSLVLLRERA